MKWTIVVSTAPHSGDAVYNALRLAREGRGRGNDVRIFFINDAVDSVRSAFPAGETRELLDACVQEEIGIRVCTTCVTRCGIGTGSIREDVEMAAMTDLTDWVEDADRVLTF